MRLIRDGEKGGKGVWRWGKREIIYLSLRGCHLQNDFCIKMGSDESHFNVSVGSDGQSQDSVHTTTTFSVEEKGQPKPAVSNRGPSAYQPNALPLGQTGSCESRPTASQIITVVRSHVKTARNVRYYFTPEYIWCTRV